MQAKLKEYAKLLVEVGLNVQPGQTVLVRAPVGSEDLVYLCAEAAYDAGAREVAYEFSDGRLTRLAYLRADGAVFGEFADWKADKLNALAGQGAAFLTIVGDDPDMLRGVDPDRIARQQKVSGVKLAPYREATMNNRTSWCVAAVPTPAWARKVFPALGEREAVDALFAAILKAVRVSGDGGAVERFKAHCQRMRERCRRLNALDLASLHYTNSLGTDLVVELPENARWLGGVENTAKGVPFVANMPTEEIFTAPKRDGVHGKVVSSLPFSLSGNVIDAFGFTLQNGKITGIEAGSEAEEKLLLDAISLDEGAAYLGEVALVPYDSPIRAQEILFYNTLFDENAACHFAFGRAYPCIEGGDTMTAEELSAHGINQSITHKDFMIGTKDMKITGKTRDGREVPIFIDGNFAF